MTNPYSVVSEQLHLFSKLFPQFKGLINNWQEDLEDTRTLRGNPAQRVFRAIREGYTLQSEICVRADVAAPLLEEMVAAEVLTTIEQGGKTEGARGARKKIYQIALRSNSSNLPKTSNLSKTSYANVTKLAA